jgi:hypothetical protein
MQFKSITFILACAMATGLMASPLTARDSNEYIEHYREKSSNGGVLIYYGPVNGAKKDHSEVVKVEKRGGVSCSANAPPPDCGSQNSARNDICVNLLTDLQVNSAVAIPPGPNQICYYGDATIIDAYCCVSWHDAVPNIGNSISYSLNKGDLVGYAADSMLLLKSAV